MLEILAEVTGTHAALGVGGLGLAGVIWGFLIKREVNRVLNHIEDTSKHLNKKEDYVSVKVCEATVKRIEQGQDIIKSMIGELKTSHGELRTEMKESVQHITERIDRLLEIALEDKN
jgi:predicted HTH transcriptional regulator